MVWIINAWAGGWPGAPPDDTQFPNTFDVDYMRVYRVDGLVAAPALAIANVQDSYASTDLLRVGVANFDEVCAHIAMYEDQTLLQTTSDLPVRFPLAMLSSGTHNITLVATDGERTTTPIVIQ